MPHQRSLVEKYQDSPFVLIGVNDDPDSELVKKKNKHNGVNWRSFQRGNRDEIARREWVPRGWPSFYVLDHRGLIRKRWLGDGRPKVISEVDELARELVKEAK